MNAVAMTPEKLAARGRALYGEWWQTPLASDLGISDRTIRRWVAGESPIPEKVEFNLRGILQIRLEELGGMVAFKVNLADRKVYHYPTFTAFNIEDDNSVTQVYPPLVADGSSTERQAKLLAEGAEEAVRIEADRSEHVIGRFETGR